MRVLCVMDKFGELLLSRSHSLGGAERTALTYLKQLAANYGHDCAIATPFLVRRRIRYGGVTIESFRDLEELRALLRRRDPQVVLSGLDIIYESVRWTRSFGIPNLLLLDSYEYCEPTEQEKRAAGLSLTKSYPSRAAAEFAVKNADLRLACSRHLKARFEDRYGVPAEVLYPPFESAEIVLARSESQAGRFITGFCGQAHKGVELFWRLSQRFTDQPFLLVGTISQEYQERLKDCPNITRAASGSIKELLAQTRVVLVPSRWEEPFGRVAIEAMANGIPTLASRTGGLAEIVGDSPLGVGDFRTVEAWEAALGALLNSDEARAENARAGRWLAAPFLGHDSVRRLDELIRGCAKVSVTPRRRSKHLVIIGSQSKKTAFAGINRHLQEALMKEDALTVNGSARADEIGQPGADVYLHHSFEDEFSRLPAPPEGKWVVMRTWDFGKYPPAWAERISAECDQLWVYSRWVKKLAVSSGIPPGRVKVIPPGFDPTVFKPEGESYPLPTAKRFKFLFVGAPVLRKGADILLKAYCQAFTSQDKVSLIIKGNPDDVFYQGLTLREQVLELSRKPACPEIIFIEQYLSDRDLAALYRACQAGVFPYRAEGFALPILEAMACGLPSIVPEFGACLDYCSRATSFLVSARRINLPVIGKFKFNSLGFEECVDEVDFCEVPVTHLAEEMRRVMQLPDEEIERRRRAGVRLSHGKFTWADTASAIARQLEALDARRTPIRFLRRRRLNELHLNKFAAARDLFLSGASRRSQHD